MLSNLFWNILPLNLTILFKVLLRCSKLATGSLGSMWHCGFRLICFEIRRGNGPNPVLQNATVQSPTFRETRSLRHFLYSSINTAVPASGSGLIPNVWFPLFLPPSLKRGGWALTSCCDAKFRRWKGRHEASIPTLKYSSSSKSVLVKWSYAHFCCNESGGEVLCCRLPKFL